MGPFVNTAPLLSYRLCLVWQRRPIYLNGTEVQYQTQPMNKNGAVSEDRTLFFSTAYHFF